MKNYNVTIPFAGAMSVNVEAENEDQAKELAYNKLSEAIPLNHMDLNNRDINCIELEYYDKLISGNVRHFTYNEIDFEVVDDFGDEDE